MLAAAAIAAPLQADCAECRIDGEFDEAAVLRLLGRTFCQEPLPSEPQQGVGACGDAGPPLLPSNGTEAEATTSRPQPVVSATSGSGLAVRPTVPIWGVLATACGVTTLGCTVAYLRRVAKETSLAKGSKVPDLEVQMTSRGDETPGVDSGASLPSDQEADRLVV